MIREIRRLSEYLLQYGLRDEYYPGQVEYFCPGCNDTHHVAVDKPFHNGAKWTFAGPYERPTLHPSINYKLGPNSRGDTLICHHFLRNGELQFLNDCTHKLAGKTVPLPKIPDKYLAQWRCFGLNKPI